MTKIIAQQLSISYIGSKKNKLQGKIRSRKMSTVDYLSREQVQQVTEMLKQRGNGERHSLIWLLCANTGMRISDILPITISAMQEKYLKQQKTKENVDVIIPEAIMEKCREFAVKNNIADDELLFGENRKRKSSGFKIKKNSTMTRQAVYKVWSDIGEQIGQNIGCHTPRKSFGKILYDKTKNIGLVMKFLGQKDEASALHYIGVTSQMMRDVRINIGLIGC